MRLPGQDQQQGNERNHQCYEGSIVGQLWGNHSERDVGECCDRSEFSQTERKELGAKQAAPCIRFHEGALRWKLAPGTGGSPASGPCRAHM